MAHKAALPGALVAFVILSGAGYAVAASGPSDRARPVVCPAEGCDPKPPAEYPKNSAGQTYGSVSDAVSPQNEPDLIRVFATNGQIGYSLKKDLEGPPVTSLAEAAAAQRANEQGPKYTSVPVYAEDGKKVIGEYLIDHQPTVTLIDKDPKTAG